MPEPRVSPSGLDVDPGLVPGCTLLARLGQGGMGTVYKARQDRMDRLVAVKLLGEALSGDPEYVARFVTEAQTVGKLRHLNIVSALDCGRAGRHHYLVMEYVEGKPLDAVLKASGFLDERVSLQIVKQVAEGLQHAWQHGVIHRDIKPQNVMMTPEGVAKICDFGLCKQMAALASLTSSGYVNCTPTHASPEQARGAKDLDCRTDVYSLGISFYQLATGSLPFEGASIADFFVKHATAVRVPPRERNPLVSGPVSDLILRMISPDRELRPRTPGHVAEEIRGILSRPRSASPAPHVPERKPTARSVLKVAGIHEPVARALEISTEPRDSHVVIRLQGKLLESMDEALHAEIHRQLEAGHVSLILDLSGLEYLNSRGVSVFIAGLDAARESGGDLKIAAGRTQVRAILSRLGTDLILPVSDSVDEAICSLVRSGPVTRVAAPSPPPRRPVPERPAPAVFPAPVEQPDSAPGSNRSLIVTLAVTVVILLVVCVVLIFLLLFRPGERATRQRTAGPATAAVPDLSEEIRGLKELERRGDPEAVLARISGLRPRVEGTRFQAELNRIEERARFFLSPDATSTLKLDAFLAEIRKTLARDPDFQRHREVEDMLRSAAAMAGARRAEVDRMRESYETSRSAVAGRLLKAARAAKEAKAPPFQQHDLYRRAMVASEGTPAQEECKAELAALEPALRTPPPPEKPAGVAVVIAAGTPWTDTGFDVADQERVEILAAGEWKAAATWAPCGVGGYTGYSHQTPVPEAPLMALVARVGGRPWAVGTNRSHRIVESGRLFLGPNDVNLTDNAGELRVTLRRIAPSETLPTFAAAPATIDALRPGLVGEYHSARSLGATDLRRIDPVPGVSGGHASVWGGGPPENFSIRWTGFLRVPRRSRYDFEVRSDDGVRLSIGGGMLISNWTIRGCTSDRASALLEEGVHPLVLDYFENGGYSVLAVSVREQSGEWRDIAEDALFHDPGQFRPLLARVEGEALESRVSGGTKEVREMGSQAPLWSRGAQLLWSGMDPESELSAVLPLFGEGKARLLLGVAHGPPGGVFKVSFNGREIIPALDLRSGHPGRRMEAVDIDLNLRLNTVGFRLLEAASTPRELGLDFLAVERLHAPPGPVQGQTPVPGSGEAEAAARKVEEEFRGELHDRDRVLNLCRRARTAADPPLRFACLREARDLAARLGDASLAVEIADRLGTAFPVDVRTQRTEVLGLLDGAARTPGAAASLACFCLDASGQAARTGDFEGSRWLCGRAITLTRRAKDDRLLSRAEGELRHAEEGARELSAVRAALETLKTRPNDLQARATVGRFRCLFEEQWSEGVTLLSRSTGGELATLAAKDFASPAESGARRELADAWWTCAGKSPLGRDALRRRALTWYRLAWPDLGGGDREATRRRLLGLGTEFLPDTTGGTPPPWGILEERAGSDPTLARSGARSLRLTRQASVVSRQLAACAGDTYLLSAWALTQWTGTADGVIVRFLSKGRDGDEVQMEDSTALPADFPFWSRVQRRLTAPANALRVEVLLRKRSPQGSVWLDDVSLRREGEDLELIENGSFEER